MVTRLNLNTGGILCWYGYVPVYKDYDIVLFFMIKIVFVVLFTMCKKDS
jgi:hypothetical protein